MERFKLFKNQEGIIRIQITDSFPAPRWMTDTDLMTAVLGSHRSKILNFTSEKSAEAVISQFLEKERMLKDLWEKKQSPAPAEVEPSDTFEEIKKS